MNFKTKNTFLLLLSKEEEMSSEESDVELDMEGVIEDKEAEDTHEMGDATKMEMTDEEMTKFDEARGEAMNTFSEVSRLHFFI